MCISPLKRDDKQTFCSESASKKYDYRCHDIHRIPYRVLISRCLSGIVTAGTRTARYAGSGALCPVGSTTIVTPSNVAQSSPGNPSSVRMVNRRRYCESFLLRCGCVFRAISRGISTNASFLIRITLRSALEHTACGHSLGQLPSTNHHVFLILQDYHAQHLLQLVEVGAVFRPLKDLIESALVAHLANVLVE